MGAPARGVTHWKALGGGGHSSLPSGSATARCFGGPPTGGGIVYSAPRVPPGVFPLASASPVARYRSALEVRRATKARDQRVSRV